MFVSHHAYFSAEVRHACLLFRGMQMSLPSFAIFGLLRLLLAAIAGCLFFIFYALPLCVMRRGRAMASFFFAMEMLCRLRDMLLFACCYATATRHERYC